MANTLNDERVKKLESILIDLETNLIEFEQVIDEMKKD